MRGRAKGTAVVVLVIATLLIVRVGLASNVASANASPSAAAPKELTTTSLGGYSQLGQIDMVSPHLGYALATGYRGKGHFAYYLVRTTNLGKTWLIRSLIAANLTRYPAFSDSYGLSTRDEIDFVNASVGYVNINGGALLVTRDGGQTWRSLTPSTSSTSYVTTGPTTSVVETKCPTSSSVSTLCTVEFLLYPSGTTTPSFQTSLVSPVKVYDPTVQLLAATSAGVEVVNFAASNLTKPNSLRISRDRGRTWAILANPCASLGIEQLLVAHDGAWLLSCFFDEGMSQGPGKILRSTNQGHSWTVELNDTATHGGQLVHSDTPMALYFSADDRALFATYENPAGGLGVSTNFGRTWSNVAYMGNTGGSSESLSVVGANSMLYQVLAGPIFVTHDLRHWSLLPALRAGPYRHVQVCTQPSTRVELQNNHAVKETNLYLEFINEGSRTCYLNGVATLILRGARGAVVGPPQTGELPGPAGDFVLLRPHGGGARIFLLPAVSYCPGQPAGARREVTALSVSFAPPAQFSVKLGAHHFRSCTTTPTTFMTQIRTAPAGA